MQVEIWCQYYSTFECVFTLCSRVIGLVVSLWGIVVSWNFEMCSVLRVLNMVKCSLNSDGRQVLFGSWHYSLLGASTLLYYRSVRANFAKSYGFVHLLSPCLLQEGVKWCLKCPQNIPKNVTIVKPLIYSTPVFLPLLFLFSSSHHQSGVYTKYTFFGTTRYKRSSNSHVMRPRLLCAPGRKTWT